MILGKIVGNVVSTQKDEKLKGNKLLIVQPINIKEEFIGDCIVAVDTVGAGINETVLVVTGSTARIAEEGKRTIGSDAAIVGIVDYIETGY
ncbi:EutN/CcmL family microcompartment protein [Clostridium cochlearium]|jgi:ethanolamine utilization protein EutN|uniref:Microcompartment shellprotein n=1 Tax=Clostridium cochlearium TaxID=1494 RepID=A0A239ZPG5_CLOCO|nr:EutN/CcmL family microcompartment protein [Clostridium cochlearium]MBV1818990.1 EutN/CcmL family microcompartment protein [Bacteroidales bacterium MSK.15.36]NSJ91196.1 EutN/CcmL family microcompartment protein [Coprococcus sp. MSK.21.13]MBE6064090.1 ethanolamine utilization protein EutN [Clostridium cochlearium]MBU5269286.1 EutN/CcmL family microcompartment protein [Clostridium cochlearium]MCG4572137.1 EutN/CcmL family microcompartment protein [Clostridium cochlearium]